MRSKINVNEWVWFKLTDYGYGVHTPTDQLYVGNGWFREQLWTVMSLYGPAHGTGVKSVFQNNEIHFMKPKDAYR